MRRDQEGSVPIIPITVVLIAFIVIGVMFWLANYFPETEIKAATQSLTDAEKIERLRLDARKSFLDTIQLGAAIIGSVGLLGTLFYTARNFAVAEKTYRITEVSKIIEGYAKAMDQFANDKADVRIGAIYMLGRIAQHSSDAHWNIMHHLCAYLSARRSTRPARAGASSGAGHFETEAILNVLRNRRYEYECHDEALQLSSTRLDEADFRGAMVRRARFQFADLSYAQFQRADLRKATFFKATLRNTKFHRADLRNAEFIHAACAATEFTRARLRGAKFDGASGFVTAGDWYTSWWLRMNTELRVNVHSSKPALPTPQPSVGSSPPTPQPSGESTTST